MMRVAFLCLLALLPTSAIAGGPQLTPAAAAQLDEGLTNLYNLDYAKSRAAFRKIVELEPDNPFGYLFESGGIWWQSFQEYGLFKDTPTLQGQFEQDVEAALRKSEPYMSSKDPQMRADGYFVSGMSLGTRGQWSLLRGKWFDAYFDGKKAIKHLKKCLKYDDQYNDAYLGLGVFDYQAAHLSGIARLGILLGVRGDEKRGLERITLAMEKGRYASRQAAQFLAMIYLVDLHDDARALPVIERLRKEFPASAYFLFLEIIVRHRLGDWSDSLALARELHRRIDADPKAFRRKWLTLVCGLTGPDCLAKDDVQRTLAWLDHALEDTAKDKKKPGKKPETFRSHLRLMRAAALDVLGRREEAVADYQKVLSLPPIGDLREIARACLAAPCGKDELLKRLRDWSREP
jgi:tetratricopeptide (TPR) repeat protein